MVTRSLVVDPFEFERTTGWALKPEGACRDGVCVPLVDRSLDHVTRRLAMPLVHDRAEGLWAVGPSVAPMLEAGGRAPDLELPDLGGIPHRLGEWKGKKVLILAWAPW